MLRRFRLAIAILPVLFLLTLVNAEAQTPVALPYTMTTIGGLTPMSASSGTQCPNLPAGVKSTDAYGDGCLAVNGVFGAGGRGGVQVDSFGNIFVADDVNKVAHMINPTTGIMTLLAGGGSVCAGRVDEFGDGCLAATQTSFSAVSALRGIGIDPYGNVLLAGYNTNLIHVVCRTASPLCAPANIGYMELAAGCVASSTSAGSAGAGLDNKPGISTGVACSTSLGEVDTARGATADVYGNVYYADTASERWRVVLGPLTSSYFAGNNPLWSALEKNSSWYDGSTKFLTAGYVYTVGGLVTSSTNQTAAGSQTNCNGGGTATDAWGDGCLFTSSYIAGSTSYSQGIGVDAAGNMIFTDAGRGLRVFYVSDGTNFANTGSAGYIAGQAMKNAITVNNSGYTGWSGSPVTGFMYMLAGGGSTGISATPTLGNNTAALDTGTLKMTVSPQGNIYIGDTTPRVLFFDINSGYIRTLLTPGTTVTQGNYCNGGSSGQKSLSAYSDGCPVSASATSYAPFANSNGLGVAVDGQGNLYMHDTTGTMLIRKVLAQGLAEQTLGTPLIQTFQTHFLSASSSTSTVTESTNGNLSYGTPSCTLHADDSVDCNVTVTATPSAAGLRSAAMTVANASAASGSGEAITIGLGGTVTGSILVVDNASVGGSGIPPTANAILTGMTPSSVAVDGAGNVYTASGPDLSESIGGTIYPLSPALTFTPSQIAVDQTGNAFAVNSGTSTITELQVTTAGTPSTYTATEISYSNGSTPAPVAIAVDQAGNLYVADATTETIYRLSMVANTLQKQTTVASGFSNVVSLSVDPAGNVYVADKGAGKVYELTPAIVLGQYGYSQSTKLSGVTPVALAVDPAGDVYVQDDSSLSVIEVAVSGPSTGVTVLSGLISPTGLAVDGLGNVYSADENNTSITQVVRGNFAENFGTSETTDFIATLTNVGNQASTGQNTSTSNTTNFTVTGGGAPACTVSSNVLGAMSAGQACTLSAELTGSGSTTVNDFITFLPSTSTAGELTLTGTLLGESYPTTPTISAPSGAQIFGASPEVSFTITVTASTAPSAPTGSVNVYVDSTTAFTQYSLTAATSTSSAATVNLSGLSAGSHTIAVVYPTTGAFTGSGSSSTTTPFSIAQAGTSVSWAPSATTQQVSSAIGTGPLNATVTPSIAGDFVYTATPSGGSAITIDASSYLPIGTYSLGVTFYPIDSVDYASATASVASYTVTQATATAAVGASTNVVAADGTGNYTSLSTALAALPVTGGTLYLKPGTYTGQNAISYPNVYLRGLGGDPTKVILTAEDGAFSAPFVYPGSGAGNANASGDQGSSTLDVSKSLYMGTTLGSTQFTPNNFFAEYLTIQNTYNTDATTATTYNTTSGTCANSGPSQTLQAVYNSGKQCNSQALALWIESDQAILNNVNLISQQDTLYAGSQGCGTFCTVARQYMWQGMITGDVDYVFGDAAMVFDHTNFFTTWHGAATGENTIEAQDKRFQTSSSSDYLSGYICNGCTLMSQSTGMTNLYYGRPYSANNSTTYSTWIMLNSFVDQVNPAGWIEFTPGTTNYLPSATYAEYNTQTFTDPTPGTAGYPATLFGGTVTPTGGNIGAGVTGTRETTSTDPGTLEASNTIRTSLTAAEATQYYPENFLGNTVSPATLSAGQPANWNPVTALANALNSFAPAGNVTLNSNTESVTILGRPQTPGAGVIPTGNYMFMDSLNGGTASTLASGTLDASGEAYYTTSSLATGTHSITMVYAGDSNFTGSTSSAFTITVPPAPLTATTTNLTVTNTSSTYGGTITGTVTVAPSTGNGTPTGVVTLQSGATTLGSCTLSNGTCTYNLSNVAAGSQTMTASYGGDSSYAASNSSGVAFNVVRGILQVAANNITMTMGQAVPTLTYSITGFVNQDTQASAVTGTPSLTTTATGASIGEYPITVTTGTLAASNYTFTFTSGVLYVTLAGQDAPVATGDTRTVTEPVFPAVCTQLSAGLTSVNDDIPTSVDATVTNPDGARIQAALNSCSGTGQAVELSVDGSGHNAFLTGPLSMPSNVTLLVDPGVYVYFSRNVQDYDKVAGTHTCGTVNNASATSSCLPLIDIPGTSTNVGIMGYGKLDGRGGDVLINAISPYAGYSWWGLSNAANGVGNQQNPRWIQMETGSSNITLYKITLRNSPLFHISTTGAVSGFTAWDIKIITPTSSRNTDGIDPGNAQNFTITRSWISDGDDNIAVGAANTVPAENISVTNNHFFAGHGESIGSYTTAGVSNILFDGNMSSGNDVANAGSSINGIIDGNSTGLRIKSGYDRGGVVTNIQYSNSCYQDHKAEIVFSPNYEATTGSLSPNLENILLQNLAFLTAGTVQLTGTNNNGTVYPLGVTLDNVSFSGTFPPSELNPAPTNAALTYGPGLVSSDFVSDYATFVGSNGNTVTNNITASSLFPPTCSFTSIAPELTGPSGLPQTITEGENASVIVILTPTVGGAAYPTGTVTLTDALTSNATTVTLTGTTDTISIPLAGLAVGTHTFTATYSGDSNYTLTSGQTVYSTTGPYVITVSAGSLNSTTTTLSGVPSSTPFGTPFTATATVSGSNPTGTVQFIVSGGGAVGGYVYTTATLNSGTASASISLPYSTNSYSITAIYSGDAFNGGSTSSAAPITITQGTTITALSANTTTTTLGHPVLLTATVSSLAGTPTGTVSFTYSVTSGGTQLSLGSATLNSGTASASADLPLGTNYVTVTYVASGSFAGSASAPMTITVNAPTIIGLPSNPISLPYTMTTIAGGSTVSNANTTCSGSTDSFGDGCQATAITFASADDMRAVVADPFGNVYLSDISDKLVRRIAPNGVITNFAGRVSGTACVPTAVTGCTPTLVNISKPRGVGSDAAGNIYIADYSLNEVFEVKVSTGLMYLVAGTGTAGSAGDGGAATSAQVDAPRGAWADTVGNIYIADTSDNKIRVVDPAGNIHTFAGTGTAGSNGDSGPATSAEINNPQGVIADGNLNVYIADSSGGRIRVVCVTCGTNSPLDALLAKLGISSPVNGDIYTVAGSGSTGAYSYTSPVLSTSVSMSPQKLAIDNAGNLYISDGNGFIWFLDFHTGYLRAVARNVSTVCSGATDAVGDGCPATQAKFGDGGNGIGVGADTLGNIYISDTTNGLIRKVITGLATPSTATGSTTSQLVELHFIAGDTPASTNAFVNNSTEWSLGTPACTTNADNTTDCLLTSGFTPAVPGARSTPLTINSSLGNTANLALAGIGLGAGSTLDPASQLSFGANIQVAGIATDTAGNVYVSDGTSKHLLRFAPAAQGQGASATSTSLATLTAPGAVAVDPRGFVYVADTSTGLITQISPAGTTSTLALTLRLPAGLAVDSLNNLYLSDSSAQVVYQLNPITGAVRTLATGALVAPAGLAIDPNGNLLITDPGAPAIYRFNLQSGVRSTVSSAAVKPSAVAADAAGNLLIADTASILAVPASANSGSFTVAGLAPLALAIDSAGNLYTGSGAAVLKLTRTQGYVQFASSTAPQTVNLLESGNQVLQLSSVNQTDTVDYSLTASASTDCTVSGTSPSALAIGGACALTATYTPTTFGTTTDTATFNGNLVNAALSTPSSVQLTLTGPGMPSTKATLISPAPGLGTILGSSNVAFQWTAGIGVTDYQLNLSAIAFGGSDLYSYKGTALTTTVPTLPANGVEVYATLYSKINGVWQSNNYVYTEGGTPIPAAITSPTPGLSTVLGTSNVAFQWTAGIGVADYQLNLSAIAFGGSDLYSYKGTALTTTVPTLPANGVEVYATLYSKINGVWQSNNYVYTEGGTPIPAAITSPTPGLSTILGTSNVAFQWTAGIGVADYQLNLSAIAAGGSDLYSYKGTALTTTVPTLPANGVEVYATLYSKINGVWQSNNYVYTEGGTPIPAAITSPTPGLSTILGTSNVAFQWTAGIGVADYQLNLSAIAFGGSDLYSYKGTALTTTVPTLPANGVEVYATLYSKINGVWQSNNYVYTEGGTPIPAAITSPTPGLSTILGTSNVAFQWTAGIGVADYQLNLSAIAAGDSDLYLYKGTALTTTIPTLPANGVKVYARLYSKINGVWQYNDYVYTEQ